MWRSLAVLGLLSACTPTDPEGKDDTADGDDTGDTGDTGEGVVDLGPCGPYTGLNAVGSSWTYGYTDEYQASTGYTGSWSYAVTGLDIQGGVTTILLEGESTMASDSIDAYVSATSTSMTCDAEGLWIVSSAYDYTMTIGGNEVEGWGETVYDTPALTLPADPEVGDTWTVEATGTTSSNTGAYDFDTTYTYTITDEASVEVPAGTFTTLVMDISTEGAGTTSSWMDRTVGNVLSETYELVSYSR